MAAIIAQGFNRKEPAPVVYVSGEEVGFNIAFFAPSCRHVPIFNVYYYLLVNNDGALFCILITLVLSLHDLMHLFLYDLYVTTENLVTIHLFNMLY